MKNFMRLLKTIPLALVFLLLFSCDQMFVTKDEIAAGLKSALEYGVKHALNTLGRQDGFFVDQAVKIGLPRDAANFVVQAGNIPGLGIVIKEIEKELVLAINRAAEASIKEVVPIVIDAVKTMTIQDASTILYSSNNRAATDYLHSKTYNNLCNVCASVITSALSRKIVGNVSAQDTWSRLISQYNNVVNTVPSLNLDPIETDLALYTTQKTLDGVFLKIGDEETKIRTDASARVDALLQKVFGLLD